MAERPRQVAGFFRATRRQYRTLSDLIAAYGSGFLAGQAISYECYVGLWLNLERIRTAQAAAVAAGMAIARSNRAPDRSFYEATALTEEEAKPAHRDAKFAAMEARATAKLRARGLNVDVSR